MKKILSVVMALMLLLSLATAETQTEDDILQLTVTPSYEGIYVWAHQDMGIVVNVPSGWMVYSAEGCDYAYGAADYSMVMLIKTIETDINTLYEELEQQALQDFTLVNINGNDWLLCGSSDGLVNIAVIALTDDICMMFEFDCAAAMGEDPTAIEIIGSIGVASV